MNDVMDCKADDGYRFNDTTVIEKSLQLIITNASEEYAGIYVCMMMSQQMDGNGRDPQVCRFNLLGKLETKG